MWQHSKAFFTIFVIFIGRLCACLCQEFTVSSNTHSCPKDISDCHELSFYTSNVSKYFTSNATFTFLSGVHTLDSFVPVIIANIANITFTSNTAADAIPTVQCANGTFGLTFENITTIKINGIAISGCGRTIYDSGLVIKNATTVTMEHVTIERTLGVGMRVENVSQLYVCNCSFSNNGIGVNNCTRMKYQWWYGMSVTITNYHQVVYSIVNTTFNGNFHSKLGGGLHIHIIDTDAANVTVDSCRFSRITGCLSAGANITIEGYRHQVMVQVANCVFTDNTQIDIKNYETAVIGGGAGALKIMIFQNRDVSYQSQQVYISVTDSNILRNKASRCGGIGIITNNNASQTRIIVRNTQLLNNTSGGIFIAASSNQLLLFPINQTTNVQISNSVFKHNTGIDGAGLEIWPIRKGHILNITNCSFIFNYNTFKENNNGILKIQWNSQGTRRSHENIQIKVQYCSFLGNRHSSSLYLAGAEQEYSNNELGVYIYVIGCLFEDNISAGTQYAAGIHASMSNGNELLSIGDCVFSGGKGSALKILVAKNLEIVASFLRIEINNLTATSIKSTSSVVEIVCSGTRDNVSIDESDISNNIGTGLSVQSCGLTLIGQHKFFNNSTPQKGEGLAIYGKGFVLAQEANIVFSNNKANFGGAIFSTSYQSLSKTSLSCTFNQFKAHFINNSAVIAGNNVYGGLFTNCVTKSGTGKYIFREDRPNKCKEIPKILTKGISSDPYRVNSCDNNTISNHSTTNLAIYPGEQFQLTLSTTGYCNSFSPGLLDISTSTGLHIEAGVQTQEIKTSCQEVWFKPSLLYRNISNGHMIINIAHSTFGLNTPLTVNITLLTCPHGMQVGDMGTCQCDNYISGTLKHIQCNISLMPDPFIKSVGNYWLQYDTENNCSTIANICPLDYCSIHSNVHFNLNDNSDKQCSNNRTGTLCGQCKPGLSVMLGSNACSQCTNTYLVLIVAFIVAGILLVVFILILNMTVSIGSINGLLFYANVVKLNESVLFPNGSIPVISQFISWINLDFGIEVCFFNGLDGYWKTCLQYVFPLYIWLLTAAIIVYSHYSIRFSRYLRSNIISVLATLVLMSFTKILRTITAVFMATRLKCGTNHKLVWSIDGNIEYFTMRHSILIAVSAIALICATLYTIIILFSQWLQRASNNKLCRASQKILFRLYPFIDAYTGPYTDKNRYWTGVLLVTRIVITTTFMYTSGSIAYINNYVIVFIEEIFFRNMLRSTLYRSKFNYFVESFFHLNLCALCLLNSVLAQSSYKQYASNATTGSVALSMIMFIVIVSQQFYQQYLVKRLCNNRLTNETASLLGDVAEDNIITDGSPAQIVNRRDSIIFSF